MKTRPARSPISASRVSVRAAVSHIVFSDAAGRSADTARSDQELLAGAYVAELAPPVIRDHRPAGDPGPPPRR